MPRATATRKPPPSASGLIPTIEVALRSSDWRSATTTEIGIARSPMPRKRSGLDAYMRHEAASV
jgi:hypothetical protein